MDEYVSAGTSTERHLYFVNEHGQPISVANAQDINIEDQQTEEVYETDFESLCRLCASPNDCLIPIFEGEGLENLLADKINEHLPIKVNPDDILPRVICYQCASHVLAWHDLKECTLKADEQLRKFQDITDPKRKAYFSNGSKTIEMQVNVKKNTTEVESSIDDNASAEERSPIIQDKGNQEKSFHAFQQAHAIIYSSYKIYKNVFDNIEQVTIKTEPDTKIDILEDQIKYELPESNLVLNSQKSNSIKKYSCDSCKKVFKRECNLTKHKCAMKNEENEDVKMEDLDNHESEDIFDEDFNMDDFKISDESGAEDDNKIKTYREYNCPECNIVCSKKSGLKIHLFTDHKPSKKKKRQRNNFDGEAIEKAKVLVGGRWYYNCKDCGKNLHSPYTYSWHIRIHTGERPFVCDLCGKQFRVSQGLIRHLKETHAGIKNFPCDICAKRFSTKRNVDEHRRIHTGERPYVCALCGKSFKQKASLFVHNRSHSDVRPFQCTYCDQGFRTKPPLMIHMTRHTGERPYPCDVCGRGFRIKYELKRHKLIHSEEKPFSCEPCGVSFRQKRYLRNHNRINHNITTP